MYAHPGKKLVFMGTEIGQFDEWNHEEAIQWDLLEFEKHKKLRTFFKELNKFYLDCKPLYELDTVWKGFDWIHHDDIAVEVMRVYDYLYRDYEKILEAFEHINSDCYLYSFSLNEYDSVNSDT